MQRFVNYKFKMRKYERVGNAATALDVPGAHEMGTVIEASELRFKVVSWADENAPVFVTPDSLDKRSFWQTLALVKEVALINVHDWGNWSWGL